MGQGLQASPAVGTYKGFEVGEVERWWLKGESKECVAEGIQRQAVSEELNFSAYFQLDRRRYVHKKYVPMSESSSDFQR